MKGGTVGKIASDFNISAESFTAIVNRVKRNVAAENRLRSERPQRGAVDRVIRVQRGAAKLFNLLQIIEISISSRYRFSAG